LSRRPWIRVCLRIPFLSSWRSDGERDDETSSEGLPGRDLGDGFRGCFDHSKTISIDLLGPVLTKVLDKLSGDPDPLRKKGERMSTTKEQGEREEREREN